MSGYPSIVPIDGGIFTANKVIIGCHGRPREMTGKQKVFPDLPPNFVVEPIAKIYVARVVRRTPGGSIRLPRNAPEG